MNPNKEGSYKVRKGGLTVVIKFLFFFGRAEGKEREEIFLLNIAIADFEDLSRIKRLFKNNCRSSSFDFSTFKIQEDRFLCLIPKSNNIYRTE